MASNSWPQAVSISNTFVVIELVSADGLGLGHPGNVLCKGVWLSMKNDCFIVMSDLMTGRQLIEPVRTCVDPGIICQLCDNGHADEGTSEYACVF